ncbi:MAG: hypothetical protein ABI856_19585, partial [Nitrospira sp.]
KVRHLTHPVPQLLTISLEMVCRVLSLVVFFLVLSGCATEKMNTGPLFHRVEGLGPDQAVVYLYVTRQEDPMNVRIFSNEELVTHLEGPGYYPLITAPPVRSFQLRLSRLRINVVPIQIEARHSYFLKVSNDRPIRGRSRAKLIEVPEAQALAEIADCRLMRQ